MKTVGQSNDPQAEHLERDAEPVVDEHPRMTNQPKSDTLEVPCTSEGPAKIKNTAKRQVTEPYTHTGGEGGGGQTEFLAKMEGVNSKWGEENPKLCKMVAKWGDWDLSGGEIRNNLMEWMNQREVDQMADDAEGTTWRMCWGPREK